MRNLASWTAMMALTMTPIRHWQLGYPIQSCVITFISVGFGLVLLKILARLVIRPRFSRLKYLPGPKNSNFIMGNIYAIFDQPLGSTISKWLVDIPNEGLIHFQGLLGAEYVVVTRPQGLADVLVKGPYDFEKTSAARRYVERFLGYGLVIEEGASHQKHRKLLRPVFQPRRINEIKPFLVSRSRLLTKCIIDAANQSRDGDTASSITVSMSDWASRLALDVACAITLGVDCGVVSDPGSRLFAAYKRIFACDAGKKRQFMWHNSAPSWLASRVTGVIDKELDAAYEIIRQIIQTIVSARQSQTSFDKVIQHDLLSQMIDSDEFSTEQLIQQALLMIAAGHESTATTLSWVMIELALAPALQSSLREELKTFEADDSPDKCLVDALPRLNGICCETIRLHPAVPLTVRKSIRDTMIEGETIPAGTYVVLPCEAVNQSNLYWGCNAADFAPWRWIRRNEDGAEEVESLGGAPSSYCVQTFLHGPRGCIGQALAMAEIKRATAAIVSRFRIEALSRERPESIGFITTKPKDSRVRLIPL